MEAVLYVSHGSRKEEATEEARQFLLTVQNEIDVPLYEICFLELAEPDVLQGIERLVEKGAGKIAVLPVLLLSAGHYFEDIPEEIDKAKGRYPQIEFSYGEPLGVQDRIVDVLVDRIHQLDTTVGTDTNLLLVGRGSRHPDTKPSIEKIASLLAEKTGVPRVDTCYLAAISPRFEEGLQASLNKKGKTIVLPYLWFTGILIQSMEQKIKAAQEENHDVQLAAYLNDHPNMIRATVDRVNEALEKFKEHSAS
ncbi:sirohydrochlorin ferrochelatase [Halobacillus dabanensis]|uniref:Sirohydrochlorin ferrochelatase n=1 Tax=Halobacillus dabanensis TaxID=240302 RepID=A0A1I3VHS3_HALDA|nr:sirohydrochlorin chelatase [Halobacillus dabanensis]SFJ94599.1 sirohydrochlorin ferrochelatase [Halobacillus dabanensis]